MTSPPRDPIDVPERGERASSGRRSRRRIGVIAGALAVLLAAGTAVVAVAARSSAPAPTASATTSALPTSATTPITPASPSLTGAPTPAATSTCADKFGVCMSAAQNATTRAELTALAARLPAHLSLTAPATWAQWAGATPTYADDIVSCPHLADRLAAGLGGRWTYTSGKLPTGPEGCTWTPVPWIPDRPPAERFFVTIGYLRGPTDSLLNGPDYCAGGVTAPRIVVAAVRPGAALDGCDDGYQHTFTLAFPDTAGTGVWFLTTWGGVNQPQARPADALLALIDAATRVYG
jgi:hypothetical protein